MDIYGGTDPRDIPTYSAGDAARYLNIPESTIRSWTVGYRYRVTDGKKRFYPLIESKTRDPLRLTFTNLIELHVLRAIRQRNIDLQKVRMALDYINEQLHIPHPLAHQEFQTDGVDLFIERYGALINASQQKKTLLRDSLKSHLERIEPDDSGLAIKLYPFTRTYDHDSPRLVVIDSRIAFGRLTIAGTGIAADIIAERFHAGDSPEQIAQDYECRVEEVTEAIRCETRPIAAA
ncbi:DUF433 domain-containing protein [Spirulina sp. CS-785/01]|nr:DUF433 domain-containing protein [Spirulina sp. CS-785/01]MDB9314898.1 DUF433 domain-containing protein [Spirulina sp. CS-785/01]